MYRVWGKIIKHNDIKESYVYENDDPIDESEKLMLAMEGICLHFDIQQPVWLTDHQRDILKFGKTEFNDDHFIENIVFDYLEVEIIETDDK